jgi:hypothetical protein
MENTEKDSSLVDPATLNLSDEMSTHQKPDFNLALNPKVTRPPESTPLQLNEEKTEPKK